MPAVTAHAPTTRDDYLAMVAGAIVDAGKRLPRPRRATGLESSPSSLTSPPPAFEPLSWRVYAVSDLHADMPTNMRWVESLPSFPPRSALIVAGDVATANAVTKKALLELKGKFEEVFWCFGNHELWLPAAPNDATNDGYPDDSLGKLMSLIDLCRECGVRVGPTTLPGTPGTSSGAVVSKLSAAKSDVVVVPVLGWYADAFAKQNAAYTEYTELERDFDAGCKWPACVGTPGRPRDSHADGIAAFFRDVNAAVWADSSCRVPSVTERENAETLAPDVVTFSHFVPLARVYLGTSRMARVMGSETIGAQALGLGSTIHAFGHSHVNADDVVDVSDCLRLATPRGSRGDTAKPAVRVFCRFVQNALGYPHERRGNGGAPKRLWPRDVPESEGGCATSCETLTQHLNR